MGYLTTFTIYNDDCGRLNGLSGEEAQKFCKGLYKVCGGGRETDNINHIAGVQIICQTPRHADNHTIYAHLGNTVQDLSPWSQEFRSLLECNPTYIKNCVNAASFVLNEAKFSVENSNTES